MVPTDHVACRVQVGRCGLIRIRTLLHRAVEVRLRLTLRDPMGRAQIAVIAVALHTEALRAVDRLTAAATRVEDHLTGVDTPDTVRLRHRILQHQVAEAITEAGVVYRTVAVEAVDPTVAEVLTAVVVQAATPAEGTVNN